MNQAEQDRLTVGVLREFGLNSPPLAREIVRLRAELAAVAKDRDIYFKMCDGSLNEQSDGGGE